MTASLKCLVYPGGGGAFARYRALLTRAKHNARNGARQKRRTAASSGAKAEGRLPLDHDRRDRKETSVE
jgi:hypothetical protein